MTGQGDIPFVACRALPFDRSTYHYRSRRQDDSALKQRIREICETRVRYAPRTTLRRPITFALPSFVFRALCIGQNVFLPPDYLGDRKVDDLGVGLELGLPLICYKLEALQ